MIELVISIAFFIVLIGGMALGLWLKGTPLTRRCGTAQVMMNLQCQSGCSGLVEEKPHDD